jgi:hypothetical protein
MSAPRYAALAGKLLARAEQQEAPPLSSDDRGDAIAAIEHALVRRGRSRVLSQWARVADVVLVLGLGASWYAARKGPGPVATEQGAVVASSPSVVVVGHPAGGGAMVEAIGTPAPLADGKPLDLGSRIVTRPDGRVELSLSTGTRLTIEEGGDLTLVDNGPNQVFSLRAGALSANVAKLDSGQRFLVRTLDSEIEVHGTAFRVAVADADPSCGVGTTTRVAAFEGVVSVRHGSTDVRLTAGQKWPADCAAARPPSRPIRPARGTGSSRATPVAPEPATPTVSASDLAEQNDAFARAVAAKNRGALPEALAGFESFATRYPSSQLLESALVERMRLLRPVDRLRAREAAHQYLAKYPAGFARAEAQSLERTTP